MQTVALSFLFLSILTLAGCQSKTVNVKQLQDQYKRRLRGLCQGLPGKDNSEATRLLTEQKLTTEQVADFEAEKIERDAPCELRAGRLVQLQKGILATQQ